MKKYILIFSVIVFAFASCEREYNLSGLSTLKNKPVVEGYIENGRPPFVFLTKTFSLFGGISANNASKIYVHNAAITVNGSNGQKINLKEYPIKIGTDTVFIYTVKGLDFSGDTSLPHFNIDGFGMVGVNLLEYNIGDVGFINTTYKLQVAIPKTNDMDAFELSAETKVLSIGGFDSIWAIPRSTDPSDSFARIYIKRTDNGTTKDYYRYFTSVNNNAFLPGYNSTFNDDFTNGITYDFPVSAGFNKNDTSKEAFKNFGFFKLGDTVVLKLSAIDNDVFDFWQTSDNAYSNLGNPFAAPSNVKTNIKGGGLGIWCGYASTYYPKNGFIVK